MRGGDRMAKRIGQNVVDPAPIRQPVERRIFIEALHFERPFHDLAFAAYREAARRLSGDRHHAAIDLRCEWPVDRKLGLAGGLAPGKRRIIEKREFHRAFDLQHPFAREEHRRAVGIDPRHRLPAMRRRIRQKGKHLVLRLRDVAHDRNALLNP